MYTTPECRPITDAEELQLRMAAWRARHELYLRAGLPEAVETEIRVQVAIRMGEEAWNPRNWDLDRVVESIPV